MTKNIKPSALDFEEYVQLNQQYSRQKLLENKQLGGARFGEINERLDKYYTKEAVAQKCALDFKTSLHNICIDWGDYLCIEPSAGAGVFLKFMPSNSLGLDIAPSVAGVYQHDFLKDNLTKAISKYAHNCFKNDKPLLFLGNPPFGTKSVLALKFLNKALEQSAAVGFIVPLQFRKWSVQSKILESAFLYQDRDMPEKSFEFLGKDYKLRCSFQIWVNPNFLNENQRKKLHNYTNLRLSKKPSTEHPDFIMYQYNCTQEARKYFDYDWDFALPRQGYANYQLRVKDKKDTNFKQQWIFFKAKNTTVLNRLIALDFELLSKKNIGVPGFGKADVVELYQRLYKK